MCPIPRAPRTVDTHIINEGILLRFFFLPFGYLCGTISDGDNERECVFKSLFLGLKGNGAVRGEKKVLFI